MHAPSIRPLPLSKIVAGKNVRTGNLDVADLVESYDKGVPQLHNVVVRVLDSGRYELIAGFRRVEAARQMGWKHVDAKVLVADDTMAEVIQLEENLRRKKLPNEAAAVARLVELHQRYKPARRGGDRRSDAFKGSNRQLVIPDTPVGRVSKLLGQSEREVRRKLVIGRKGTPELQAALVDGTINVLQAEKLARLPAEDQRTALHTPDEDAEMKRALSALAFVERTIAKQSSANEQLVGEVRTRLDRLQDLVAGLRTTKVVPVSGDAAAAVAFSPKSANRKLSPIEMLPGRQRPHFTPRPPYVSTTFASIQATCPDTCTWKGAAGAPGGCYADAGFTAIKSTRLDAAAHGVDADDIIEAEAAIDRAFSGKRVPQDGARGGRDLRIHVGGDVTNARQAAMLGAASANWRARGGGSVWTFTHAWRTVPRSAWGDAVSVLASVEHPNEIDEARRQGYAAAIVVAEFPSEKSFTPEGAKATAIPCPAETTGTTCAECRLCLDQDLFGSHRAIAFQAHGRTAPLVRERLHQIRRRADRPPVSDSL